RSDSSGIISAVHWICTWSKRCSCSSAVRRISGLLSVHNVRCDRQNGKRSYRIPVSRLLSQLLDGLFADGDSQGVYPVIIVSVFREIALCLIVNDNTILVFDRRNLGILNCGQGVCCYGESGNTEGH